jgi:hypothetical protein
MKKGAEMSLYGESELDSQLLQLIDAWSLPLGDGCEHNQFKKHNGKLLWSQQPDGKMPLV